MAGLRTRLAVVSVGRSPTRASTLAPVHRRSRLAKARAEYGYYLLSGLLVCAECGTTLTIRTGSRQRQDQRYGCSRRWRRGSEPCSNNILVRRDLAERRIVEFLAEKLYRPEAIQRLVEKVNARLRAQKPSLAAERAGLIRERAEIGQRLEGLRRFVESGD